MKVTSMRPEQDGSDHDYPGQVGDTGVSCGDEERESLTISAAERRNQTQDSLSLETNQGLIRVDLFIT